MGAFTALAQILMSQRRPGFRTPPFAGKTNPAGPVPGAPQPVPPPVAQPQGAPSSAPTAGVGNAPTLKQQVWNGVVNNPASGALLAAAQQLTRPRYPGETGMGNAVSAVTAGMNQLAQMRQLQMERDRVMREYQLKIDELDLKKKETNAKVDDTNSQIVRRGDQTKIEKDTLAETIRSNTDKAAAASRNASAAEQNADANTKNAESLEKQRLAQIEMNKKTYDLESKKYNLAEQELTEKKRQFDKGLTSREEYQNMQVALERQRVQLEATRLAIVRDKAARGTGEMTDLKLMSEAADQVFNETTAVTNSSLKRETITEDQIRQRVNVRYEELKKMVKPAAAPDRIPKDEWK